jgi:hypothetical protein
MGHLYRFVEPVILLLLLQKGETHGYELANELPKYGLTDAEGIDRRGVGARGRVAAGDPGINDQCDTSKEYCPQLCISTGTAVGTVRS